MSKRLHTGLQRSVSVWCDVFMLSVCAGTGIDWLFDFGGLLPFQKIQEAATASRVTTRYTISLPAFLDLF